MGIDICLETHGGLLATGEISKKLIQDIGKDNISINYDPGNVIFYGGVRPEDDIKRLGRLRRPHARQGPDRRPGRLELPGHRHRRSRLPDHLRALDEVGFDGICSVEVEFQGEPWPSLADVNAALKTSLRIRAPVREVGMFQFLVSSF